MKFNKDIWNMVNKYIKHTKNNGYILIHNKFYNSMFVYNPFADKRHSIEYMLDEMLKAGNMREYLSVEEIEAGFNALNKEFREKFANAI